MDNIEFDKIVVSIVKDEMNISENKVQISINESKINHYGTDIEIQELEDGSNVVVMNYESFKYIIKKTFEFGVGWDK